MASAAGRHASLGDLPDECLLHIFGCMALQHRQAAVPLVCRRWSQLCTRPELLSSVVVDEYTSAVVFSDMQSARLFFFWMHRYAVQAIQTLLLHVYLFPHLESIDFGLGPGELADNKQQCVEIPLELTALLGAIAAAGRLQHLHLELVNFGVLLGPWLLPLASTLRTLDIKQEPVALLAPPASPLCHLTALRTLELCSADRQLDIHPDWRLAPNLSRLGLATDIQEAPPSLPCYLSALSCLQDLTLSGRFRPESTAVLSQLHSLRAVEFKECWAPPLSVLHLTGLERLKVNHVETGFREELPEALAQMEAFLSQLTRLVRLTSVQLAPCPEFPIAALPDSLGAISGLSRLYWQPYRDLHSRDTHCSGGVLPAGLTALQSAYLSAKVVAASSGTAQLASARQLTSLCVLDFSQRDAACLAEQLTAVQSVAVGSPLLRRLVMCGHQDDITLLAEKLRRLLPLLAIHVYPQWFSR